MSRCFSLFLLALLGLTAPSWATHIYVSGDQTGTWAADTVIVTAEVRVPPGQSLIIQPGVEVLFSVYCKLIVDNGATLRAMGTEADSIRFDVLPPNANWHGLRFLSASSSCYLKHCHLTHGAAMGNGSSDRYGGGIYIEYSSPTVQNCLIDNCIADPGGYWWGTGGAMALFYSNALILNNTISGNTAMHGGGISADHCAQPVIKGNIIIGNMSLIGSGGGIRLWDSHPLISDNVISGNSANGAEYGVGGGICIWAGSAPMIHHNLISGNSAHAGGGIHAESSSMYYVISDNLIFGNSVSSYGGGINCCPYIGFNYLISHNIIEGNNAASGGGISYSGDANASLVENAIGENTASYGGGIYCENTSPNFSGNTISENVALYGSGIYSRGSNPNLVNCVLWGNIDQQIVGRANVTYSDIQGGYAGTGNIDVWPAFVDTAQSDYRLQWGSPCIDIGDPHPYCNDPDSTRSDMGAWYYDQSRSVRILLTPSNALIKIPATGGSFQYAIQMTNIAASALTALGWCDVTFPSGAPYGPVLGPLNITLAAGQTLSRVRTQVVPASAPAGLYHYNAYASAAGDTSTDSFTFVKLGGGGRTPALQPGSGGWTNTGEEFYVGARHAVPASGSGPAGGLCSATPTMEVSPNPFNPTTVASFELQAASFVNLSVYDIAGRLVTTLVNGWREAGEHQVAFDGSRLPSGVYLYHLQAGAVIVSGKMVLLK